MNRIAVIHKSVMSIKTEAQPNKTICIQQTVCLIHWLSNGIKKQLYSKTKKSLRKSALLLTRHFLVITQTLHKRRCHFSTMLLLSIGHIFGEKTKSVS